MERNQIVVWFGAVDRSQHEASPFESVLSVEEAERAGRFRSARDRQRYIVAHGMLRSLLAGYMDCEPRQVAIRSGANGKPYIVERDGECPLQFSMSHSGVYATFAFGRCKKIGVDIEQIKAIAEMQGIIAEHFTPREKEMLLSRPEEHRLEMFYRFWTRKEAVLKAQGEGMLRPLVSVDVASGEGSGPWRVGLIDCGSGKAYSIADIEAPPGYRAALAVGGEQESFSVRIAYFAPHDRRFC